MKTTLEMAQEAGFWKEHTTTYMCSVDDIKTFEALVREECVHSVMLHSPRNGHDSPENKRLNRIIHSIRTGEHVYV